MNERTFVVKSQIEKLAVTLVGDSGEELVALNAKGVECVFVKGRDRALNGGLELCAGSTDLK